ncbi:hypothetical protein PC129_g22072 [Phytophthora cactorum]|uniref:Uncharacterized protein n=1 Tax=Phytophthora cactorum TaxID=29920 RepID=A0A8T1AYS2_9STRA|nr:hypothetical protein PC114_g25172 [Phytophthora cactorum]KAG2889492.1 hypothetical protein PC117_g24674 [Phytophthora cactorum]KAG3052429.1 hypothetical protein PC122_g22654 [Phytophthora cactorum]KAG3127303.1 hypothetical protein C6341_g25027 [Phytophthora cactorum]KAG3205507.1 hypothetical protein PC129_g22072 [Phytophthora cactorum]
MNVDGTSGQKFGSCRGGRGQAAVVPESPQPGSATPTGATASTTTPTRTPPIMLQKETNASLFQIRWLDSQFQSAVEHINVGVVQLGIENYIALTRVKNPDWRILVRPDPTDEIDFEENDSDCEEEEVLQAFDPTG